MKKSGTGGVLQQLLKETHVSEPNLGQDAGQREKHNSFHRRIRGNVRKFLKI